MFVFRCTADRRRAWGVEPGEFSPPGVWEHPGWPAVVQRGWPGDQRCKEKRRDTAWRRILSGNLWIRSVMPNMAAVPSLTPKPCERVTMSDWCKFATASAVLWEHFYSSLFLAYCNHITLEADFSHSSVLCMQYGCTVPVITDIKVMAFSCSPSVTELTADPQRLQKLVTKQLTVNSISCTEWAASQVLHANSDCNQSPGGGSFAVVHFDFNSLWYRRTAYMEKYIKL